MRANRYAVRWHWRDTDSSQSYVEFLDAYTAEDAMRQLLVEKLWDGGEARVTNPLVITSVRPAPEPEPEQ